LPYVFQEYPKWVHRPGKPSVLVEDADEEAALFGVPAPRIEPERNMLVGAPVVAAPVAARKGGWPKGKPRNRPAVN
jgi:hypothetical protein